MKQFALNNFFVLTDSHLPTSISALMYLFPGKRKKREESGNDRELIQKMVI